MEENNSNSERMKRVFQGMQNSFMKHYFISEDVTEKFSQLLWENPKNALNNLFDFYDKTLDKAYIDSEGNNNRSFIEAECGGPHGAIPSAFYNSIGGIYPFLNRELKNYALGKIFGILDLIDFQSVQRSHTYYIKEPLLLSDISIASPLYWPGMDEGEYLIKKYNNLFCDFKSELINEEGFFKKDKVKSDFIVGYSLLRNDFCNWGEEYAEISDKNFLERVIQGIVGMRFAKYFKLKNLSEQEIEKINKEARDPDFYSRNQIKLNNILDVKISKGRLRLKELLPVSLHKKIEEKMVPKDWAEPFYFGFHNDYLLKKTIERYVEE